MKYTRRVKITTTRRRSGRLQPPLIRAHCHVCAREVELLTPVQAGEVLRVDDLALGGLIAAGQVHAIQTVSHSWWVCKDSLFVK